MRVEEVKSLICELAEDFFRGATVIFAEQINTKPAPPYVTIKMGGINRTRFPIVDGGQRHYHCSAVLEVNLYTKGKPVTAAKKSTGNWANTATADLMDFFNYLDSDSIQDKLAEHGVDISLEPPVRDLTDLQNDSKYRYRAMAEATVSFAQAADGRYGIGGTELPNPSGGGAPEMADGDEFIEEAEITEASYEGGIIE